MGPLRNIRTTAAAALAGSGSADLRRARLRAAAPRWLASATMLVLVLLGLRALLLPPAPPRPPVPPAAADAPSEDLALRFARAYLGYDAARPGQRSRALAGLLPAGQDAGAGFFAPHGSRRVLWADVASDQPALAGGRTITVAAAVSGAEQPLYLAVTVQHRRGQGVALAGYPSFVGSPLLGEAGGRPGDGAPVEDRAVSVVVERALRNYLSRSAANLEADLTPDAVVTLPTLALRLRSLRSLEWIAGPGSGAVLATLTATDSAGAAYTLAYELGIAERERPYIDFVEVIPTAS